MWSCHGGEKRGGGLEVVFVVWLGQCVTLRVLLRCCVPSTCVHIFLYMFAKKRQYLANIGYQHHGIGAKLF